MLKISSKVSERIASKIKHYQRIAIQQRDRDVAEADTVTLVKDILSDICGFDKYQELTSEQQIKGTYCDLAIKLDGKIKVLLEIKSAGMTLSNSHLRQAVSYGVRQGIDWVVLTNALDWRIYKIKFGQPPIEEEIASYDFTQLSAKSPDDLQKIFLLCKEGLENHALDNHYQVAEQFNRHTIAVFLQTEPVLNAVRREITKHFSNLKIDNDKILRFLTNEVIKREAIYGDKYLEAEATIKKISKKLGAKAAADKRSELKSQAETAPPTEAT
jgi:predicted type IV restriction endonuclease